MLPPIALSLAVCDAPTCVEISDHAIARGDVLLLGDAADLSSLPPGVRKRAAALIVLRIASNGRGGLISKQWLSERARQRMPLLSHWLPATVPGELNLERPGVGGWQTVKSHGDCLRATRSISAHESVRSSDFEVRPCPDARPRSAFSYDRSTGAVRTSRDIGEGAFVAKAPGLDAASVNPGDRLTLVVRAGPVRIMRNVEALQAAKSGEHVFVRTDGGDVLTAFVGDLRQ